MISFSNVIVEQITEDAFEKFPLLEDVLIQNSQIGHVDSKVFDKVKKVKFADCGFEDSPDLKSEKLQELHFGRCKLDEIPPLDNLFSLKFLNLSGNYINNIDIMSFAELFDLETLILSNNEITRIPANVFVNNEELNSLYLDNNPLKYFFLNTSNKLETLSLKNCYLTSFDYKSTSRLDSLNELILSNNKINSLKARDMVYMEKLTVVDLSNNSLTDLDNDLFIGNPNLQKLTLDGNKFSKLPNFTLPDDKNFEIYTLSCKDCGLTAIHKNVFAHMPALIRLNLANNKLNNVADMFDFITSLRMLDISYNNISKLSPVAFQNTTNLETLNIAGNPLLTLNPEAFLPTKAIKKIDASHCRLYKLWSSNTTYLKSLRKFIISDNQLTTLSLENFSITPYLQVVDLHNNPLKFDDNYCRVLRYFDKHGVYHVEYSNPSPNPEEMLDDIDNFTQSQWLGSQEKKCPEISNDIDAMDYHVENDSYEDVQDDFETLKKDVLINDDYDYHYVEDEEDSDSDSDQENDTEDAEDESSDDRITAEIVEDENSSLAKASYILSVTSVFVLTALAVLILAVTFTLFILKRNNNFNMHKANLPRIKILRWESPMGQKKHSGSVYQKLSEELNGPPTPKCSRYEFGATPTVHTI